MRCAPMDNSPTPSHATATLFLLLHERGRVWDAEGTQGTAVPNVPLLSETCLNSPQSFLQVVYRF